MYDSSGLRIRVDLKLRQEFLGACREQNRSAAQVLRDFMRSFVAENYRGSQASLFEEEPQTKGKYS